ncbi:MAG: ice-binding family protein [Nocardioides sp.]
MRLISATALTGMFLAGPLATSAHAVVEHPPLLTARNFSVLAGSEVTNTGPSSIAQNLGVSPGTSLPLNAGANQLNVGGATYSGTDAIAIQAKNDLDGAYTNAANQIPRIAQDTELGGETLVGGIYNVPTTADMGLTGVLTLDGANNPDSIWVFQARRALNIASSVSMVLIRGANPCNIYWQVSSTATLGTASRMIGTIMAETSVVMQTGATLQGRILARTAEITMDTNVITNPACQPVGLEDDDDDTGGTGGTGGTNGGTGSAGGVQVAQAPAGAVDTGVAGPDSTIMSGWVLAAGFGGLAVVALRRRQHM